MIEAIAMAALVVIAVCQAWARAEGELAKHRHKRTERRSSQSAHRHCVDEASRIRRLLENPNTTFDDLEAEHDRQRSPFLAMFDNHGDNEHALRACLYERATKLEAAAKSIAKAAR